MALVKCKECGSDVSTEAKACPKCGAKPPKGISGFTILVIGIVLFFLIKSMFGGSSSTSPAPQAATKVDPKKEADFQNVLKVAKWAKSRSKNPNSFELTYGGITGAGTVCIEFRGTNSFNAVVPGRYIMSDTVSGDTSALWNANCANRPITDYTYARTAL